MANVDTFQTDSKSSAISTMGFASELHAKEIGCSSLLFPDLGSAYRLRGLHEKTGVVSQELMRQQRRSTVGGAGNAKQLASFKVLESWVGRVTEVDQSKDQFWAMVVSDLHPENRERAEFTLAEISDDDQLLVKPGALFYWSVGYQINEFGNRMSASTVRFKRIRHWTRKELLAAEARSAEYSDWFTGGAHGLASAASR